MQLTQKPEPTTVATAAAKLAVLRRQESELDAQLATATRRMYEMCRNKAIPPRDHDREAYELNQRIVALRAEIHEAEAVLRDAEGQARIAISRGAKPEHDKLRVRVIRALEELRDALDAERRFRDDLDFSSAVITAVRILDLDHDTLEAVIEGQKGYLG